MFIVPDFSSLYTSHNLNGNTVRPVGEADGKIQEKWGWRVHPICTTLTTKEQFRVLSAALNDLAQMNDGILEVKRVLDWNPQNLNLDLDVDKYLEIQERT